MFTWTIQQISVAAFFSLVLVWCWSQWKNRRLLRLARSLPTIKPTLPVFGHLLHSAIRHKLDLGEHARNNGHDTSDSSSSDSESSDSSSSSDSESDDDGDKSRTGVEEKSVKDAAIFKESCVDIPLEAAMKGVQNYCLWIGPTPFITTQNPDDIKTILTSSKTLERTYIIDYVKFAIGDGLLTAPASTWKPTRRHIEPMFQSRNLELLMPTFNRQSKDLVRRLANLDGNSSNELINAIYPLATLNALDLVFGPNFKVQESKIDTKNILNFVLRSFHLWTNRILYMWLHHDVLFKILNRNQLEKLRGEAAAFLEPAAKDLQKILKQRTEKEKTVSFEEDNRLSMTEAFASLIMSNSNITEEHFKDNVCTFMAGGIDTTSVTLSTCMLMLAMHPTVQDKVFEEVSSAFRGLDEDLFLADISSMVYTEQVLKETMRLFPIFPAVSRKVSQDIKLSFGVMPAGSVVGMSMFGVHRNPKFYPDPLKFNPEHFSVENRSKRPAFAFIPFSAGPRNCIGKNYSLISMKTTLAHVIREYQLTTNLAFDDIQLLMNLELTIKNGFPVKFHRRKKFV